MTRCDQAAQTIIVSDLSVFCSAKLLVLHTACHFLRGSLMYPHGSEHPDSDIVVLGQVRSTSNVRKNTGCQAFHDNNR